MNQTVITPPADVKLWIRSSALSPRQVEEWSVDDDNVGLYRSSIEDRRKFLAWKSQYLDWPNTSRYWKAFQIPMRGRVLELGAGNFWLSSFLSTQPQVESVVGVELSLERLVAFRDLALDLFPGTRRDKITYVVGDMHQIQAEDATFDIVTCDAVLHHADNLVSALREAWRVLKPGGWFLALREPSISPWRRRAPRFHSRFPEDGSAMYYYPDGWRSAFINAWFVNVGIRPYVEYGIVRGHAVRNWPLRRALRQVDLRILLNGYPKVCVAGQKPTEPTA